MRTISLELPDDLADQLSAVQDRLPELLSLSLHQPALPAELYRSILTFLANAPTAAEIAAFTPPPEAVSRLQTLLDRERAGSLSHYERAELDELELIEHLMILLKTGAVPPCALAS
ncbi:MAG TPA: hypothetical protein VFE42_08645 [Chloroflexota bacterium]|nr:hypothetical protein [Chloroflexota bacterium]